MRKREAVSITIKEFGREWEVVIEVFNKNEYVINAEMTRIELFVHQLDERFFLVSIPNFKRSGIVWKGCRWDDFSALTDFDNEIDSASAAQAFNYIVKEWF